MKYAIIALTLLSLIACREKKSSTPKYVIVPRSNWSEMHLHGRVKVITDTCFITSDNSDNLPCYIQTFDFDTCGYLVRSSTNSPRKDETYNEHMEITAYQRDNYHRVLQETHTIGGKVFYSNSTRFDTSGNWADTTETFRQNCLAEYRDPKIKYYMVRRYNKYGLLTEIDDMIDSGDRNEKGQSIFYLSTKHAFIYDNKGKLVEENNDYPMRHTIHTYNSIGDIVSTIATPVTSEYDDKESTYVYDAAGNIVEETRSKMTGVWYHLTTRYVGYDEAGNWLEKYEREKFEYKDVNYSFDRTMNVKRTITYYQ